MNSNRYTCEICGGNHPSEAHIAIKSIEVGHGCKFEYDPNTGSMKLMNKEGTEFDLRGLIPEGTTIEHNTYNYWGFDQYPDGGFVVCVGEFRSEEDIAAFLHEGGHANDDPEANLAVLKLKDQKDKAQEELVTLKNLVLDRETTAWEFAKHQITEIQKRLGINITDKFVGDGKKFPDIEQYIKSFLCAYEQSHDKLIKGGE